jgi:hypothetical protein
MIKLVTCDLQPSMQALSCSVPISPLLKGLVNWQDALGIVPEDQDTLLLCRAASPAGVVQYMYVHGAGSASYTDLWPQHSH